MLWTSYRDPVPPNDISALRDQALALDHLFDEWHNSRVSEFMPITIANIDMSHLWPTSPVGLWPGKVDTYLDLYVAGIWNIFRSAKLLLLALVIRISESLGDTALCTGYSQDADRIFTELAASIPYHLTENLPDFINNLPVSKEITDSGRSLGGLLLMHPLYVASMLPFLHEAKRQYMRDCLAWIGSNMGFGQADLLAKV